MTLPARPIRECPRDGKNCMCVDVLTDCHVTPKSRTADSDVPKIAPADQPMST